MQYLVALEKGVVGYGANAPDLPKCVAVGPTRDEALARMRVAIEMHPRGMREDGEPISEPNARAEWLVVA